MVFWKRDSRAAPLSSSDPHGRLRAVVEHYLPGADEETWRIVTAVAGLLGCVAYVDSEYAPSEEAHVREELGRVHGLTQMGVDAICGALATDIAPLAAQGEHVWARELLDLGDRELRVEVLDVLVDLAAADEALSMDETHQLRRIATMLGLEQRDYDAAQARHRDKLTVLRRPGTT